MSYKDIILSKDGNPVPVFADGNPAHSRYSPIKEGIQFAARVEKSGFFIVAGLCGAYHISAMLAEFPDAKIIAVESNADDIDFLQSNMENARNLIASKKITAIPAEMTESALLQNYLPAMHGTFSLVELPSWKAANPAFAKKIEGSVKNALKKIAADFSVQANFGKLWQRNILLNLRAAVRPANPILPVHKTAFIAAAGPSLDSKIEYIKMRRKEFYIISTDTAYSVLRSNGIFCDAVCSIDGQAVSCAHFYGKTDGETLFIFDLCAQNSAVRKIMKSNADLIFSSSGHPLAQYAQQTQSGNGNSFICAGNGAGTVTIMAADFAAKAGFEKILIAGADFAYISGKSYASGTYLDKIYGCAQNRVFGVEEQFCRLMFRAPLKYEGKYAKTEILDSYRTEFENWAASNGFKISKEDDIYSLCRKNTNPHGISTVKFDFEKFTKSLKLEQEKIEHGENINNSPVSVFTLPYIAHIKKQNPSADFRSCVNLALADILRYTF